MPIITTPHAESGGTRYELPGVGNHFVMPPIPESAKGKLPVMMFAGAAEQLDEAAAELRSINDSRELSAFGKEQKMLPLQHRAILGIARLNAILEVEERHINKQEAALLAVPTIDPSNSVAAIEAREVRDWFRTLDVAERTKVLDSLADNPENDIVTLALLRSPIKMVDWHVAEARKAWNQSRRLANPAAAMEIESGRAVLEWSRRGMGFLSALTRQTTKFDAARIADVLVASDDESHHSAHQVFSIGPSDVQLAKARREAQAARSGARR